MDANVFISSLFSEDFAFIFYMSHHLFYISVGIIKGMASVIQDNEPTNNKLQFKFCNIIF